jgi:integrase
MRRKGSSNAHFVKRIPADLRDRMVGMRLSFRIGTEAASFLITEKTASVRFSLRTSDLSEVKVRQAEAAAHLENVFRSVRDNAPISLSHRQAVALSRRIYESWADSERPGRRLTIEYAPDGTFMSLSETQPTVEELRGGWEAAHANAELAAQGDLDELEKQFGPIVDRVTQAEGLTNLDARSREYLLVAFAEALRDAFAHRLRNAQGNYSEDPKASRFPEWQPPKAAERKDPSPGNRTTAGLRTLVEDWWREAKAIGRKPSTYESYRNTVTKFAAMVRHEDALRITPADVVRFKDERLASGVSARTVKDSDLAALKTIFGWAKVNGRLPTNPAEGITLKVAKKAVLRSKGFSDEEAVAILTHSLAYASSRESPKLVAAKRWVPWLCAFTGARAGEMLQLRKEDIKKVGEWWVARITPEAGTVKTNEAREVVLHHQLIELGFAEHVAKAPPGHLFVTPTAGGDVLPAIKTARNKVGSFVREVVQDPEVDPSHGWRHRFKTTGVELEISSRVLDAIQGHKARSVSETYGDVTLKAKAQAIARFSSYSVAP